jgi:dipeptidyl aminopeptidase/acylaminoacyl peptidase
VRLLGKLVMASRISSGRKRLQPGTRVFRHLIRAGRILLGAGLGAATGTAAAAAPADAIDETVAGFFRSYQHDRAVLSPDGRHVAMTENIPGKPPALVIVDVGDRSARRHAIDPDGEHAALQLRWVSPTRLVFTTQGRAVGLFDLDRGEIEALLVRRNYVGLVPEPELGLRRMSSMITPDMPADTFARSPADLNGQREVSLRDALRNARVTGDAFSAEARPMSPHALRPFILGSKAGAPHVLQIELREDADLFAYREAQRSEISVPGNVYLYENTAPQPANPEDLGGRLGMIGERAVYDILQRPPPLLVIELDTKSGRWRELTQEADWRRAWTDHQGRLRLALEQQGRRYRYLHRAPDSKKWIPLESVAKTGSPLGLTLEPGKLLGPRVVPLGFDAKGEVLFVGSNLDRDTFALRALNLVSGRFEPLEVGHERFDLIEPTALTGGDTLRFDPHTRSLAGVMFAARREVMWFDAGMKNLQAQLAKHFAPQGALLLDWTADRQRFLVDTGAPGDPGGFHIVDIASGKIIRCGDRAPWLTEERRNPVQTFDFITGDGRRIAGYLTRPRKPRVNPPPVLIYFHDGPWFADGPQFNRGAQALASLGFAVLQLNHRGSSGFGLKHLEGFGEGLDRAVLEDVRAMLERSQASGIGINTRLAAAFGNGIGGYLAVRMAQLAPEIFRCAVAINAPGDLAAWQSHPDVRRSFLSDLRPQVFGTDREKLERQSALAAAPKTTVPVLVVHGTENAYVPLAMGKQLFRALKQGSAETALLELPGEGHGGWSEQTTSKLFAELGRFFNATIYNYGVEIRKAEAVESKNH